MFGKQYYQSNNEMFHSPLPFNHQRDQQQELYPNEQSFLSDFNIQDELFGGDHQTLFPRHLLQEDSILPISRRPHQDPALMNLIKNSQNNQEHHHIAHKNNELLNKLVGTKRRKVAQDQIDQPSLNVDNILNINETINSSTISTNDNNKQSMKGYGGPGPFNNNAIGGGTGGDISSYSSKLDPLDDYCNESVDDYQKAKKRMQNRESAIRSRMKKKAYFENVETQFTQLQQENNKLKLDNAALRAENQLLKRYLNYFENLFAKKTQSTAHSYTTNSNMSSKAASRCGGLSDDEIYNGKQLPMHVKKRQHNHTEEQFSQISQGDNEASRGPLNQRSKVENNDVSFVLERKTTDSSGSSPGKLGIFTIALVMCVCCMSSFFSPAGVDSSMPAASMKGFSGKTLKSTGQQLDAQIEVDQEVPSTIQLYSDSILTWSNFLKLIFLVFFAMTILTFPMDDIKQWAARKSWLRKIFNLNDIPIQASKSLKSL